MSASLKNISKLPVTLVLDHAAFLNPESGWKRGTVKFGNYGGNGTQAITEVRRSYPGTLTILPGQTVNDLHPAIRKCAQVPGLLASKVLRLTVVDDEETKGSTSDTEESKGE